MFGKVKIGSKEVELLANAATPYRYNQIFHDDYMKKVSGETSEAEKIDLFVRLGFVMAKQAEGADMNKLNEDMFFEWLEGFEANDLFEAAGDISLFYAGTTATETDPK